VCACWAGQVAGGSRDRDVVADRYRPSRSSTAANVDDAVATAAIVVHVVGRGCGCDSLVAGQVWIVRVVSCGGMIRGSWGKGPGGTDGKPYVAL